MPRTLAVSLVVVALLCLSVRDVLSQDAEPNQMMDSTTMAMSAAAMTTGAAAMTTGEGMMPMTTTMMAATTKKSGGSSGFHFFSAWLLVPAVVARWL